MLIYHPAFDAYHGAFRMLALLTQRPEMELEKARILDFFLAFPSALGGVRWPKDSDINKRSLKGFVNPYRDPLNAKATFRGMQHLQSAAVRCIAASELIEIDRLELGWITRTDLPINGEVASKVEQFIDRERDVFNVVAGTLADFPLLGPDGLKARSELMEFRYDAV